MRDGIGGRGRPEVPGRRRWQVDREVAAFAGPFAARGHAASVKLDETLDDRETEPEASLGAIERLRLLIEIIEHPPEHFGRYADALITHRHRDPVALAPHEQADDRSRVGSPIKRDREPGPEADAERRTEALC